MPRSPTRFQRRSERGLMVEIRNIVPSPRHARHASARSRREPDRMGTREFVRDLPDGRRFANDSRGLLYLLEGNNQTRVYSSWRVVSVRELQPARERLHRLRFPSRVREERPVLHGAQRARAGEPHDARLHSARLTAKDVTYHNVITEWRATNPAANAFEGTRRELLRGGPRRANLTHRWARRVQSDREARRRRLRSALHQRQ